MPGDEQMICGASSGPLGNGSSQIAREPPRLQVEVEQVAEEGLLIATPSRALDHRGMHRTGDTFVDASGTWMELQGFP